MDLRNLEPSYDESRDSQQHGGLSLDIGARFYNDGLASDDKRCFEAARRFYEKSLSFGNPQAAVNLGYIYEYGRLGEEDAERALELFEQAAFCEHPEALYKLGDMLYWRNIEVADEAAADARAFALYGKAHRLAQGRNEPDWLGSSAFRLGGCFKYGRGCARDYALVQAYYVQAAANFEAALDDANIDRFAKYLRKFDGIQFALVTHQKATMEHADVLYGVTMPEQGVSKVLSLRLGDDFEL